MLETFSPLQVGAYGAMTLLSVAAVHRVASVLDCLLMLRRQRTQARRLCSALAERSKSDSNGRILDAVEALRAPQSSPAARFFATFYSTGAAERLPSAKVRLVADMERTVLPLRYSVARLSGIAGPLGLGFTVLALIVYLIGDTSGGAGVSSNLLQALPVSLGTTAIACFNVVLLKLASSWRLRNLRSGNCREGLSHRAVPI